jgi:Protein of unknown function (DUF3052)
MHARGMMRVYGTGTHDPTDGEGVGRSVSGDSEQVASAAVRFGLAAGDNVGEIGYDDDVDHELREAIEEITTTDLLDEDADEVLDAVLLWWRADDGDLTDALVEANTLLADDGVIWLLTPRTGRDGYVEPSEIGEATRTAGLASTTTASVGHGWTAARLVRARSPRQRR